MKEETGDRGRFYVSFFEEIRNFFTRIPGRQERLSMEFFGICGRRGFYATAEQAYRNLEKVVESGLKGIEIR